MPFFGGALIDAVVGIGGEILGGASAAAGALGGAASGLASALGPAGIAAGVQGVTGLIGAETSANAAQNAANIQAAAAANANQLQAAMFNQLQANQMPYMQAGGNALTALQQGLGLAPGSTGAIGQGSLNTPFTQQAFQASPAYQFELQQGLQAAQNAASRAGGLGGNQLLALQQQGQGLAQMDYQQQLQNYMGIQNQQYSQLAGLTNLGQNAAAGVGQSGQAYANAAGQNILGAANAQSAAQVAGSNALGNAFGGAANAFNQTNYLSSLQNLYNNPGQYGIAGQVSPTYAMTGAPLGTSPTDAFAQSMTTT
jgi:hypothetical protein